jgi:2-iminobutanoate/2-iminopropanoate deaminase
LYVPLLSTAHTPSPFLLSSLQITDYSQRAEMDAAYLAMMPHPPPARSCIGVKELPRGTDVEIEAMAVIPREAKL